MNQPGIIGLEPHLDRPKIRHQLGWLVQQSYGWIPFLFYNSLLLFYSRMIMTVNDHFMSILPRLQVFRLHRPYADGGVLGLQAAVDLSSG